MIHCLLLATLYTFFMILYIQNFTEILKSERRAFLHQNYDFIDYNSITELIYKIIFFGSKYRHRSLQKEQNSMYIYAQRS